MQKRTILALIATSVIGAALTGCSGGSTPNDAAVQPKSADAPRATSDKPTGVQATE